MIEIIAKKILANKGCDIGEVRGIYGQICSYVGIILNILLSGVKLIVGTISGSVSIVADGINNFTDAVSSIISLVGFKLSVLDADKEHPFGHGRIEYISGMLVAIVVILMGVEVLSSSIRKILNQTETNITSLMLILLFISILVKLYMLRYNSKIGNKINSLTLRAVAIDSLCDVITTSVVLLSAIISIVFEVEIDGYIGIAVSLFILYSGVRASLDSISILVGQNANYELRENIEKVVKSYTDVIDMHDLIIHDYGANKSVVTMHVEMPSDLGFLVVHEIADDIETRINKEFGCDALVHLDPVQINEPMVCELKITVENKVREYDNSLEIRDFRVIKSSQKIKVIFDVATSFSNMKKDRQIITSIENILHKVNKDFIVVIKIVRK